MMRGDYLLAVADTWVRGMTWTRLAGNCCRKMAWLSHIAVDIISTLETRDQPEHIEHTTSARDDHLIWQHSGSFSGMGLTHTMSGSRHGVGMLAICRATAELLKLRPFSRQPYPIRLKNDHLSCKEGTKKGESQRNWSGLFAQWGYWEEKCADILSKLPQIGTVCMREKPWLAPDGHFTEKRNSSWGGVDDLGLRV